MRQRNSILEPRPWRQCTFAEWISHLEAMDAWDESLQNMRHSEWVIHRKLGEAAGLAHRYIIPARGGGKSMFVDSFDDPKMILRKNQKEPEQEFVTIKDADIEKWLLEEINRERIDEIVKTFRDFDHKRVESTLITSFNPYLQPDGYWYDPSWEIKSDGSIRLREISIMPGYLYPLDEEGLYG